MAWSLGWAEVCVFGKSSSLRRGIAYEKAQRRAGGGRGNPSRSIVRAEVYPVPNLDRLNLHQLWPKLGALEGDLLPVFPSGISSMSFLQNLRGDRDAGSETSWIR